MNWEVILSIISICISIFALLFFSLLPTIKIFLVRKSFWKLKTFFDLYKKLNPILIGNSDADLTKRFIRQGLFQNLFPNFDIYLSKILFDKEELSIFELNNINWIQNLSYFQTFVFWYKIFLLKKKIEYIANDMRNFEYIYVNKNKSWKTYYIKSRENIKIIECSISLVPSFDVFKLRDSYFFLGKDASVKFDYKHEKKNDYINKKFIKELKSKKYSINLVFHGEEDKSQRTFSILINGKNQRKLIDYFDYNKSLINKKEEAKIQFYKEWIEGCFCLD